MILHLIQNKLSILKSRLQTIKYEKQEVGLSEGISEEEQLRRLKELNSAGAKILEEINTLNKSAYSVSEKINEPGATFKGTPPLLCLLPTILLCSKKPSLLISPITVSPPSASMLASSRGTALMVFLTLLSWLIGFTLIYKSFLSTKL